MHGNNTVFSLNDQIWSCGIAENGFWALDRKIPGGVITAWDYDLYRVGA